MKKFHYKIKFIEQNFNKRLSNYWFTTNQKFILYPGLPPFGGCGKYGCLPLEGCGVSGLTGFLFGAADATHSCITYKLE